MNVTVRSGLLAAVAAAAVIPMLIAKSKDGPVYVDPGFKFEEVDTIYLLPAVDLTVNKDKNPEQHLQQVDCATPYPLKKRGYATVPEKVRCKEPNPPTRMTVTEDDLKQPEEAWIRKLGPENAHWVLVLALEDASSHMTFGSTGKAIVMGTLFDRQNGKLVWRAVGTGKQGQGGLIGIAAKGAMTDMAIDSAVEDLCAKIEKRKGKGK